MKLRMTWLVRKSLLEGNRRRSVFSLLPTEKLHYITTIGKADVIVLHKANYKLEMKTYEVQIAAIIASVGSTYKY